QSVGTMARHLHSGGVLLIEPFFTPEQYWTSHLTLNVTEDEAGKIAWMYTSKRERELAILDIHYLVGTRDEVTHLSERHVLGLFSDAQYTEAIRGAGLNLLHGPTGPGEGYYVARMPR